MASLAKAAFLLIAIGLVHQVPEVSSSTNIAQLMGLMMQPLNMLPSTKGMSASDIGNKPFTKLLNTSVATLQAVVPQLGMTLSPALASMLDTMKMKDLINYYKGFQLLNGASAYNFTSMLFLSHAVTYDSPLTTNSALQQLATLTGNSSIAPFFNTTTAALSARYYLSDFYPKLLKKLPDILSKTKSAFFLKTTRLSEKYYRALVGTPKLVDDILKYREQIAFAAVKGEMQKSQMLFGKFATALRTSSQSLLLIGQKLQGLQAMKIMEATTKCNIPLATLKSKSLIQIILLCLKLPEDFPLLSFVPKQQMPLEAFQTSIANMAQRLKVPVDSLLQKTITSVMIQYMKGTGELLNHTLSMPIFYAAKLKKIKIADIPNMKILDLASKLRGIPVSEVSALYNLSEANIANLQKISFKSLPDVTQRLIGMKYTMEHFYFVQMNSIITAVTDKTQVIAQKALLLQMFGVPVDETAITGLAEVFNTSRDKILQSSVLSLLVKMSGVSKEHFQKVTKMVAQKAAILENMSLSDLKLFSTMKGQISPAVLSMALIQQVANNPMFIMFFSPLKSLIGAKMPENFNLQDMLKLNPKMRVMLTEVLDKMKLMIVADLDFNYLRSAMNMSESDFGKQSFYGLLKFIKTHDKIDKGKTKGPYFGDFHQQSLKKTLKACKLKPSQASQLTMMALVKKCYKFPFGREAETQLKFPPRYRPLMYDVTLEDYKNILNLGDKFSNSTPVSLWTAMNTTHMDLFVPLRVFFKNNGKSLKEGFKMAVPEFLKKVFPSQGRIYNYFDQSIGFNKESKSILDMNLMVSGDKLGKEAFANLSVYAVIRKAIDYYTSVCGPVCTPSNICDANLLGCLCKGMSRKKCVVKESCAYKVCPAGSQCKFRRFSGAVCRCEKRGYIMKNGECKKIKGVIMKVTKLKFKQKYRKEYADVKSKEFKAKAAEIEDVLYQSVCKKIGCIAIVVTAIREGSIVVDFNAVFASDNVTATQLQDATVKALNSSEMASLQPEKSTKPQARKSDACQSGVADCGMNSVCTAANDGSYACSCEKGYEKVGDDCKKKGKGKGGLSTGAIIGIIVAVCVILIIIIVIVIVMRSKRRQGKDREAKYGMVYDAAGEKHDKVHLTGGNFAYGGQPEDKHDEELA